MRKIEYREVIKNLSEALTETRRQLASAMMLNHELSVKLAEANAALSPRPSTLDPRLSHAPPLGGALK